MFRSGKKSGRVRELFVRFMVGTVNEGNPTIVMGSALCAMKGLCITEGRYSSS